MNDLDGGVKCTLNNFTDDTKMGGVAVMPEILCCHPEEPLLEDWRNGLTGSSCSSKKKKKKEERPAPGEEEPQAPGRAGSHPAGSQLCRKGPGIQQVECEPAVHTCSKEGCNICPTRSDQQFTYTGIPSPTVAEGHATWAMHIGLIPLCCSLSSPLS